MDGKIGPIDQLFVDLGSRLSPMAFMRRIWLTCSSAFEYLFESLTRSHICAGVWARSIVFMKRYRTPGIGIIDDPWIKVRRNEPSFSLTVAYREFARGHDCRLHSPVTLYSFRQKFWVIVLRNGFQLSHLLHVDSLRLTWLCTNRIVDLSPTKWHRHSACLPEIFGWEEGHNICIPDIPKRYPTPSVAHHYALSFSSSIELQTFAEAVNNTSFTTELSNNHAILSIYSAMSRLSFRYAPLRTTFRTRGFEPCPGWGHYVGHGRGYRWKYSKYDQQYGHEGRSRKSKCCCYSIQLTSWFWLIREASLYPASGLCTNKVRAAINGKERLGHDQSREWQTGDRHRETKTEIARRNHAHPSRRPPGSEFREGSNERGEQWTRIEDQGSRHQNWAGDCRFTYGYTGIKGTLQFFHSLN